MLADDEIFRQIVEWMRSIKESLNPKSDIMRKITAVYVVKREPDAGKIIL